MTPVSVVAKRIFDKYRRAYKDEVQGCCLLIADEIVRELGGEVVAGWLTWYGGSHRRSHWWVERLGVTIDPMGDEILKHEEYPGREVEHRDAEIFRSLLPNYEQWRVQ